jgi:integrase
MTDQLPAIIHPGALAPAIPTDTCRVPAMVAALGDQASWRYVEFFAANIRNPHTRRAYARACRQFFGWCDERDLRLSAIRPFHVAAWVEQLQEKYRAPAVKQQLAAVRMLFDWLVTGQVVPMNPPGAVRGPKHVVKTGKTPVLDPAEWRRLIDSIPTGSVRDLRDRALVEDLRPQGTGWQVQLHEKGGKQHAMPCHHALAEALRIYIDAAGIADDKKGYLFRTRPGHNATALTEAPMNQADAWRMMPLPPASLRPSVIIRFGRPASRLICPTAAHWSMHSRWPRTKARGQQSSTTEPRNR